ncbi:MAG: hypothetical protein WCI87_08500, partial [Euryarchaeota archaeon]
EVAKKTQGKGLFDGLFANVLKFIPKTMPVATIGVSQNAWQSLGVSVVGGSDTNRLPSSDVVMAGVVGAMEIPPVSIIPITPKTPVILKDMPAGIPVAGTNAVEKAVQPVAQTKAPEVAPLAPKPVEATPAPTPDKEALSKQVQELEARNRKLEETVRKLEEKIAEIAAGIAANAPIEGVVGVGAGAVMNPPETPKVPKAPTTTGEGSDQTRISEALKFFTEKRLPEIENLIIRQQAEATVEEEKDKEKEKEEEEETGMEGLGALFG